MQAPPLASLMDCDAGHDAVFGHQLGLDHDADGSMSEIDEEVDEEDEEDCEDVDEEAFHAVFPQAPTLVKHHALRPVVDALRMLIAKPEHLVAALLPGEKTTSLKPQDLAALETKAQKYTQSQLASMLSDDDWKRVSGFSQRGANHEERWTPRQLVQEVDELMIKLTVYYARTWEYIKAVAIGNVHYVETTIAELHLQWTPDSRREPSMMALMTARLPAQDLSAPLRPLRLRSQTVASTATPPPRQLPVAASPAPASAPASTAAASSANHRVRLARQSNEFMIAWFLHHKSNPYPSGTERVQIAKKTGLTEQQVRNWFANMRKRHWKPKAEKKSKQPRCLLDMLLRQNDTSSSSSKK